MCSILFLIFNSRTPLRGATLAQSKGSVARAASTHAHGGDRWWMSVRITLMRLQLTHPCMERQCIATILMMFLLAPASFSPPTAPFASA